MSKVFIEEETLLGIGNAIREKNGTTDLIATTDMAQTIINLPTGGGGGQLAITSIRATNKTFDLSNYINEDTDDFILGFCWGTSTTASLQSKYVYRHRANTNRPPESSGACGKAYNNVASGGLYGFITTTHTDTAGASNNLYHAVDKSSSSNPQWTYSNKKFSISNGNIQPSAVLIYVKPKEQ